MLQLRNTTPFAGTILLLPDESGIDSLYAVVKGTFTLGERLEVAETQVPVILEPVHHGDPSETSVSVPSDVSLMKPSTDVLLLGHAHAPEGRTVTQMDVHLEVGDVRKTVRVFGDRRWRVTPAGVSISRAESFERMPLVWERAYGGVDNARGKIRAELRNPVGTGFRANSGDQPLDKSLLPNLEDPADLISSWKQRPAPACFAPIAAHWEPRRSFAGTYGSEWEKDRAPYLPDDFDARFFHLSTPDLVTRRHLQGGEWLLVQNASRSGSVRCRLPVDRPAVTYILDGVAQEQPAVLDTVIIEPDMQRLQLVWRAVLQCDKKALRVSEVRASLSRGEAA